MKETYEKLDIEIICFEECDTITCSLREDEGEIVIPKP